MGESNQDATAKPSGSRAQFARSVEENLFEVAPDAVFVTDESGLIWSTNPRVEEIFGYAPGELNGQPIEVLVPQRFRRRHTVDRANFNAHPRIRPMGVEMGLFAVRKDGTELPVDILLKPIETPSGPMVISFVRDMTESRLAQEEKYRIDRQMRAVVESIREYAVYLMDCDGNIRTWNPGAEASKGYAQEEVLGRHYSMFFTPEDVKRGEPAELLRKAAKHGKVEQEGWRVRKDGERFWAQIVLTAIKDPTGALTGYSKVVRDITHSKRAWETVMLRLTAALLANQNHETLLQAISASVHDLIPHDCATLGTVDFAKGTVIVQFLRSDSTTELQEEFNLPLAGSHLEEAVRIGAPLLIPKLIESHFRSDAMVHLLRLGMKSACCVPLTLRGEIQGTLLVASRLENGFGQVAAEMLMEIAGQVAMALHNSRQLRQISEVRDKLSQQMRYLQEEINLDNQFEDIVGESTGLRQVLRDIETVAPTDATVLIEGETGTGKELLARAIHRLSKRSKTTFIKLNCAAIPSGLIESELFGHEKGAFTGAIMRKIGKLELAHEGTLFLDEIGELPLELQPKLLRALQEHEIERLGSNSPLRVNVRLVVATNRNLAAMVADGKFRSDLYYRLKVFPIYSPSLRERKSDIPALVRHFVTMHSRNIGKAIEVIPEEAMRALVRCNWPGNIRELENFIERSVILTQGRALQVPVADLRLEQDEDSGATASHQENEREHILRVLRETRGQIGGPEGAAMHLGLKRTTLHSKMKKLGIHKNDFMSSR